MKELLIEHPFYLAVSAVSLLISLRLFFGIWVYSRFREVKILKKIFWSFIVFIPFVGPIFYLAFFNPLKSHKPGERCPVNSNAFNGGR